LFGSQKCRDVCQRLAKFPVLKFQRKIHIFFIIISLKKGKKINKMRNAENKALKTHSIKGHVEK